MDADADFSNVEGSIETSVVSNNCCTRLLAELMATGDSYPSIRDCQVYAKRVVETLDLGQVSSDKRSDPMLQCSQWVVDLVSDSTEWWHFHGCQCCM